MDIETTSDAAKLKQFYEKFPVVRFKKGEIIYVADDEPDHAYAVKSGFVRSFIYTETNDERSISFVLKNELLPIATVFSKSKSALFTYIAHTDCELYKISLKEFHKFISAEKDLAQAMLMHSMNDSVTKMLGIQALEQNTAELKVLHTLDYFCISYGKQILKNLVRIEVPLTQKDIASFTGLTRETVTIIVTNLKSRGLLSVKRHYYSVNTELLRESYSSPSEIPKFT